MVSFAESAKQRSAWKTRTPCGVGRLLASLPKDEAADIEAAFADPDINTTAIVEELAARYGDGVPARSSVSRHRRRYTGGDRCQCE